VVAHQRVGVGSEFRGQSHLALRPRREFGFQGAGEWRGAQRGGRRVGLIQRAAHVGLRRVAVERVQVGQPQRQLAPHWGSGLAHGLFQSVERNRIVVAGQGFFDLFPGGIDRNHRSVV